MRDKDQKIILPERSYKINDLRNGKTFYYKTTISNDSPNIEDVD